MQVRLYQPEPPTSIQGYCNSGIWSTSLDTPDLNQIIGDSTRQRSTVLSRRRFWGHSLALKAFQAHSSRSWCFDNSHTPPEEYRLVQGDNVDSSLLPWLVAASPRRSRCSTANDIVLYVGGVTDFQYFIYSESDEERSETRVNEI